MKQVTRIAALAALLLVGITAVAQDLSLLALQMAAAEFDAKQAQAAPRRYEQFVVAEDVVTQYVNGELRFCQRRNLKGRICGQHTKVFGKEIFEVMDWWRASTFVQAYTGRTNIQVTGVAPGQDSSTLVIYFK